MSNVSFFSCEFRRKSPSGIRTARRLLKHLRCQTHKRSSSSWGHDSCQRLSLLIGLRLARSPTSSIDGLSVHRHKSESENRQRDSRALVFFRGLPRCQGGKATSPCRISAPSIQPATHILIELQWPLHVQKITSTNAIKCRKSICGLLLALRMLQGSVIGFRASRYCMAATGHPVGLTLDTIVLATDFSPASEKAAGYAKALARHFSSNLTLAHVIDTSIAIPPADATRALLIDEMRDTSAENLARLLNAMTSAGVRASAHTLEAEYPAEALVGFAMGLGAHLIVEGTRARHGFSGAVLGSRAEEIIRH